MDAQTFPGLDVFERIFCSAWHDPTLGGLSSLCGVRESVVCGVPKD